VSVSAARELGADLFITTPFNITDVLREVESTTS
jgi:hypothetical protein